MKLKELHNQMKQRQELDNNDKRKNRLESYLNRYSLPLSNRDIRIKSRNEWDAYELHRWDYWISYRGKHSSEDKKIK